MADMVEAALVQEAVNRGVSLLLGDGEDQKASKVHDIQKLEILHSRMEFALESSKNLPILSVPLLCQRQLLKRGFEECGEALQKSKVRVQEDDEAEQAVTHSSFPRKIVRAVKSLFSANRDELSRSGGVGRFEWYADKAGEFIRDVESSCSLARYRFFNPLIRQLLEGQNLVYKMEQGSRRHDLGICSVHSEEHGVLARLQFCSHDCKIPTKCFTVHLLLRLSECTDIVGIATKCLRSLGPQLQSLAEVAIGELCQLPTQDFFSSHSRKFEIIWRALSPWLAKFERPDPLCCRANGHMPCANNVIPSELSFRFPEQVISMRFHCSVSAFEYKLQSSADEAERNVVDDWPPLKLTAALSPHSVNYTWGEMYASATIGDERQERIDGTSLQQVEEMVLTNAITCFLRQPELTRYDMSWRSPHGNAYFAVEKPKEKVRPKPRAGPKTRRTSKRMC